MSKMKLILIVALTVVLVGSSQMYAQMPGGAPQGGEQMNQMGQRGGQMGGQMPQGMGAGGFGGQRGGQMGGFGGMGPRGGGTSNEPPYPETPASQEVIDELVATAASSDASLMDRSDALRQLSVVGNAGVVSKLAPLLADPELSHMTRYALQPNPSSEVDEVFRNALDTLEGIELAGVIHSIGVRGDTAAVSKIAALLEDSDEVVSQEAAKSLGNIGNEAAVTALNGVLEGATAKSAYQNAVCEGLLRCAENLGGNRAVAIYDQLAELDAINSIRTAGVRGAILARGNNGVQTLRTYLGSDDYTLFVAAVRTTLEMTVNGVTNALTDSLSGKTPDNQILIIEALGYRGDASAGPTLLSLINNRSTAKDVRIKAINVMPQISYHDAIETLMALMNDLDPEIAEAATTAVATMPGTAADDAVLALLDSNQASQRLVAVRMIQNRGIKSALSDVISMAGSDSDASVRQAALTVVGNIGTEENLDDLLNLAMNLRDSSDMDAAIEAISTILSGVEDSSAFTSNLLSQLGSAQPAQKTAIISLLRIKGGAEALEAVKEAVGDSNSDVHTAALNTLSSWPDFDAAAVLVDIASESDVSTVDKVLALRGVTTLIRDNADAETLDQRVELSLKAYDLADRDEERTLVISAMATLRNAEVGNKLVEIAQQSESLRNEAAQAALRVATALYTGQAAGGRGQRGGQMGGQRGGQMGGQRGGQMGGQRGGQMPQGMGPGGFGGQRGDATTFGSPSLITTGIAPLLTAGFGGQMGGQRGGQMPQGMGPGGFGGRGGFGQAVTVTEEDMAAAVAIAEAILALNVSEELNATAQSIIDGTISQNMGFGGQRGGFPGGQRGGQMPQDMGQRGQMPEGMTPGGFGGGQMGGQRGQ